jgi:hypothetical protein
MHPPHLNRQAERMNESVTMAVAAALAVLSAAVMITALFW